MDSGNSGSLQSSSGDEEYDSRSDSISAALMTTPHHPHPRPANHNIVPISNVPPLNTTNASSFFDPLSNYFDPISRPSQNPNSSLLNLDMPWSKTLRSDPNSPQINPNPMMVSSPSLQSLFGSNQQLGSFTQPPPVSIPPPPVQENASATNTPRPQPDHSNPSLVVRSNPKKRSRASRRAPTTVLTTDTTNFRAMVQEFTGIPAPPFTSSSFPRARFDLYAATHSPQEPAYLRRPFPQKVQLPPPFLAASSPSLVDHHAAIASPNTITTTNNNINSSNTFQIPHQSANLFNLSNPILASLLQSNSLKPQGLDEFGLGQGHVNTSSLSGLPGLVSSDQTTSRDNNNPVNWGSTGVLGSNDGGDQSHQNRSAGNGNFSLSRMNAGNGKLDYSGSSSGFHGNKGSSENAAVAPTTRGEGMMNLGYGLQSRNDYSIRKFGGNDGD